MWSGMPRGGGTKTGYAAASAGDAAGRGRGGRGGRPGFPDTGQPGDDRGVATADDEGEPGRQLPDHVRGGHVVAGGVVLAADLSTMPARIAC